MEQWKSKRVSHCWYGKASQHLLHYREKGGTARVSQGWDCDSQDELM